MFKSIFDFNKKFGTEDQCYEYLKNKIFPLGVHCLNCSSKKVYQMKDKHYYCNSCKSRFSIRRGTVFENSRVPLKKWFYTIYVLLNSSKGMSSLQLSKHLEVRYETAWAMAHKIKSTLLNNVHGFLGGDVEINETYTKQDKESHVFRIWNLKVIRDCNWFS